MTQYLAEFRLIVFANDLIDAFERYAFYRIRNDEFLRLVFRIRKRYEHIIEIRLPHRFRKKSEFQKSRGEFFLGDVIEII